MEKKFQIYDLAVHKSAFVKYENALKEYFEKNNIYRDKDVHELYLPLLELKELRSLDRFKNLKILWLQSNQLKTLPFIQNCFSLTEIYLQSNLIQSIENTFRNLYNLNVLFLQTNQITDLKITVKELSYLKHLRNLNLFDNPICLEKNYRHLVVYHVPSLAIFDRNTVKQIERVQAIRKYEPEKLAVKKKMAFMRCLDVSDWSKRQDQLNISKCDSIASFNFSMSDDSPFKFTKHSKTELCLSPSMRNNGTMFRSVKEYSFFDWSKVDLYENKTYFEPEQKQKNNENQKKIVELPQIVTLRFT